MRINNLIDILFYFFFLKKKKRLPSIFRYIWCAAASLMWYIVFQWQILLPNTLSQS